MEKKFFSLFGQIIIGTITLFLVLFVISSTYGKEPEHLKKIKGENSNFVFSFDLNGLSKNKKEVLYTQLLKDKSNLSNETLKQFIDKYLKNNKFGGSFALKLNTEKLTGFNIKSINNIDNLGYDSLALTLGNKDFFDIVKGVIEGNKEMYNGGEFTQKEKEEWQNFEKNRNLNFKNIKDIDNFIFLLKKNSKILGKKIYYEMNDKERKNVDIFLKNVNLSGKTVSFYYNMKGYVINGKNFKDFYKTANLKDGYIFIMIFDTSDIEEFLKTKIPDKINSSLLGNNSILLNFVDENKINSFLKILKGLKYVGIVISEKQDKIYFKVIINSSNISEFNSIKDIFKTLINTQIEKIKNNLKNNKDLKNDENDLMIDIINGLNTNNTKLEIKGNNIILEISSGN